MMQICQQLFEFHAHERPLLDGGSRLVSEVTFLIHEEHGHNLCEHHQPIDAFSLLSYFLPGLSRHFLPRCQTADPISQLI